EARVLGDGVEEFLHDRLDLADGKPPAPLGYEDGATVASLTASHDLSATQFVSSECRHRLAPQGDDPFLAPLSPNLDLVTDEVEVVEVESLQFGDAHPRGVERLDDGQVARVAESAFGGADFCKIEEVLDVVAAEPGREVPLELGRAQRTGRIGLDVFLPVEPAIEGSDGRELARDGTSRELAPREVREEAA